VARARAGPFEQDDETTLERMGDQLASMSPVVADHAGDDMPVLPSSCVAPVRT
jgi:hypothetical protein